MVKKHEADLEVIKHPHEETVVEEVGPSTCDIIMEELPMLKWRVLFFCCFLTFGSYYIYDFPGAIGTGPKHTIQLKFVQHGKEYNQAMNLALYSVYSWPNSVLAIFGGLLIDKYLGLRRAMLLFTTLVLCGAGLFALGVHLTSYPLLIVARVVFGLGGESLSVAQSAFVARWFKNGRGMALAFGITISFARVGSSFNFLFSPWIAKDINIDIAVLMGVAACGLSLLSCLCLIWLDVIGTRRGDVPAETMESATPFNFKEIKELPTLLWISCGICVFSYCSIFPFVGVAENFFQRKFGISHQRAGQYVSIYQFTSAGGSPVVGFFVDALGRFCFWIIAACSGFIGVHIILIFTMAPPEAMMIVLGIMYSLLVSSLWPSIPYCVDPAFVGFAYGVITALQNFGLASFPLIVGGTLDNFIPKNHTNATMMHNHTHTHLDQLYAAAGGSNVTIPPEPKAPLPTLTGYYYAELIFIISAAISLFLAVIFLIVDRIQHKGMLAASPKAREELKKEYDAEHEALINSEKDYGSA